jgi:hypothetical protein
VGRGREALNMDSGRSGQALILTVMSATVMMAMMAAGISIGTVYVAKNQLQQAVDAAAVAGADAMMQGDPSAPGDQSQIVTANDPAATDVTLQGSTSSSMITASATAAVPGGFAALFGIRHFVLHASAEASYGPGPVFNYAIFQGSKSSPLNLSGWLSVTGSVRSNNGIDASGYNVISGDVLASTSINSSGYWSWAGKETGVPTMNMPNWQSQIQSMTPQDATIFSGGWTALASGNSSYTGNVVVDNGSVNIGGYSHFTGTLWVENGQVSISGNSTITGSIVVVNGSINISGYSTIGGNLIADGGSINLSGDVTEGDQSVALAALGSGQTINVSGYNPVNGLVYAPEGTVNMSGDETVNGAIAANMVNHSGDLTVDWTSVPVPPVFQRTQLVLTSSDY